jgi:hypothetical protein
MLTKKDDSWRETFRAAHPFLAASASNPEKLRLILGVGRSGTTWMSKVFSRTRVPARSFVEPLFRIEPRLPFHGEGDHTAVPYEELSANHPLQLAYELLTHPRFNNRQLKATDRQDAAWELCLVKEVHALLGTEGLLRRWKTPAILIVRDPVYVADSLFAAQTLNTIYLDHEADAVLKPAFLDRFLPGRQEAVLRLCSGMEQREARERILLTKVVCMQLLQEMFVVLAREFAFVKALRYEQLCESPLESFKAAALALALPWNQDMEACLAQSMQADSTSGEPYSTRRDPAKQQTRPFKFLAAEEVALCRSALETIAM